jgi:hypothetical protein
MLAVIVGLEARRNLTRLLLLVAVCFMAGCVSKKTAEARARAAFLAGQQQEAAILARQQQSQFHGPTVTVLGEVRNSLIPWTLDLTLAKAVIAAEYYGRTDPTAIVIQREGNEISYDSKTLLSGQDVALQPGDVIELRQ